jgi:hypothetical protein
MRRFAALPMLVQAAWAAIKTEGRLQARYRRLVRRLGGPKNPAAVKKAIHPRHRPHPAEDRL